MNREFQFKEEAREGLVKGVNLLADAIKVTLGAQGRYVTIDNAHGLPKTTKDGYSIARDAFSKDRSVNMGIQMLKHVTDKTVEDAGDGTTTSAVLTQKIVNLAVKNIAAGANPVDLKQGIEFATHRVIEDLESQTKELSLNSDNLLRVASISANNDNVLGSIISETYNKIGVDGKITIDFSQTGETYSEVVEGMEVNSGLISPLFVTSPEKLESELKDPYIIVTDKKITKFSQIHPLLDLISQEAKPVLIICDSFEGEALTTLATNHHRGLIKAAVIKAPSFKNQKLETLEDIAIHTGATVISENKGMSLHKATLSDLGRAVKIISTKTNTTIIDGFGKEEDVKKRVKFLKNMIKQNKNNTSYSRYEERLARLISGVAVIYAGGNSTIEQKEIMDRIDDSVKATKAALQEGVVIGGGATLLKIANRLSNVIRAFKNPDIKTGYNIVLEAIQEPIKVISENAGKNGSVIAHTVLTSEIDNAGYNAKDDAIVDMLEEGILDPKKVTRVALQNSVSVANMIITTECSLPLLLDEK